MWSSQKTCAYLASTGSCSLGIFKYSSLCSELPFLSCFLVVLDLAKSTTKILWATEVPESIQFATDRSAECGDTFEGLVCYKKHSQVQRQKKHTPEPSKPEQSQEKDRSSSNLACTSHLSGPARPPSSPIYNTIASVAGRRPASGLSFLLCRSAQPTIIAFSSPTTFTTSCCLLVKIDYDTVFRVCFQNTLRKLMFFAENRFPKKL